MIEELVTGLQKEHNFSEGSISFLSDKGFREKDFQEFYDAMRLPDQTFAEWRTSKSPLEKVIEQGDSTEITTGRYKKYLESFNDISSEQALVKGRIKFAIEYDIALADFLDGVPDAEHFVKKKFTEDEISRLRSIYQNFRTKDYVAVKIIEKKTNHDIVAANTWATIRAQQKGLDDDLMRRITHFARTSDDVNANVIGELYMKALGQLTKSLSKISLEFEKRAETYAEIGVAQTHGQDAQLTTMGHIFANLANQLGQHAHLFLEDDKFRLDGKIAGAIGTDTDWKAAFPNIDPTGMYTRVVKDVFGLKYIALGNDQSSTNASFADAFDAVSNVNYIVEKTANDLWHYASRGILAKKTKPGESGSSAMPQKANPFLAEGSEALVDIINSMIAPIKKSIIAYRGQGDLRRSLTMREAFHPLMLSVIAVERVIDELNNYEPNLLAIEEEIYANGPKIISSCINTRLRKEGVPDAYDSIKKVVMKPRVRADEVESYIDKMIENEKIDAAIGKKLKGWVYSVIDTEGLIDKIYNAKDSEQKGLIEKLKDANNTEARKELIGNAIPHTYEMIKESQKTRGFLSRYTV